MNVQEKRQQRDLYVKALDLLDNGKNWCKGEYGNLGPGPYCAVGAVYKATDILRCEVSGSTWELMRTIGGTFVTVWNDRPERTFKDVKKLFMDTIKRLDAEIKFAEETDVIYV